MLRSAIRRLALGIGVSAFALGVIVALADPALLAPDNAGVAGGLSTPAAPRN